jgi:hypothetical protein
VELAFDQDVIGWSINAAVIEVDDHNLTGQRYRGTGGSLVAGNTFLVSLEIIGSASPEGTTLTAGPDNQIYPLAGGSAWDGVTGLALPFP